MDIKKYEVLLNTLDKGGFARACEDLGYTQPGITHMMKSMEREIGFPLLKRNNRGIQLTREGEEVLPLIRELVKMSDRLNQKYDSLRGVEIGKVRVSSFPTVACAWLPKVIATFQKQYPNIEIELLEENSLGCQERWLSRGFVDLCFISRQPEHSFKWYPLLDDPYYALLPDEHPLTAYDSIAPALLQNQPFLMCKSKDGPDADINRYLTSQGVQIPPVKFSSNLDFTIALMVKEGLGVSLLPDLMLRTIFPAIPQGIELRPMNPPAYRELGIAIRSGEEPSPAMERFIECAQSVISELI